MNDKFNRRATGDGSLVCPACGIKLQRDAVVCTRCGADLESDFFAGWREAQLGSGFGGEGAGDAEGADEQVSGGKVMRGGKLFADRVPAKPGENPRYFSLQNLSVGYNGKPIIRDINIDIGKGEIVSLIGPNGAGKSTILKSITRQLAIIGGHVIFDGGDIMAMSFKNMSSRLAVVLTDRLHPELMTCHDIVATGRYPYTGRLGLLSRDDEDKVDEAMAAVHAQELGGRDFNSISDGQKQRVLLARAICQEPDVLLLDEPTSFLDIRYKLDLLSILRTMAKGNGITVITSLHEIDLAMKISDKIVCVKGDQIFRFGSPEDIFEEGMIRDMYGIENGYFDPLFGSIELPRAEGEIQVFVISSSGHGIPVFRHLQKNDTPFAAGILYTNDVDYQLARLLAMEVVCEQPFTDISNETYEKALAVMAHCPRVIYAGADIGPGNALLQSLIEEADRQGKLQRS